MSEIIGKGTIIVVDDDSSVREVVSRALRRDGYDVVTAANGREALDITARKAFDLVFLDIKMPGLNGLDVLTLMTAGRPNMPVVILTGLADPSAETVALDRQAVAFLRKPCSVRDITGIANKLLSGARNPKSQQTAGR